MINIPFFTKLQKKYLGIDIGTSFIRVVELSGEKDNIVLENYGEISVEHLVNKIPTEGRGGSLLFSEEDISGVINHILKEAGIKTKKAYFAIPDFVSFFTSFSLPAMKQEEIVSAVQYHSQQYIPLPLSEVVLDWSIAEEREKKEGEDVEITLIAVPNEAIEQYQNISKSCGLDMGALEGEVFGLARSLTKKSSGVIAIIDIGSQSTTVTMTNNGIMKNTYSIDIAGNMFADKVASSMRLDYTKAKEILAEKGVSDEEIKKSINALTESLSSEINRVFSNFQKERNKTVKKMMLVGGMSLIPGMKELISSSVGVSLIEGNCFEKMTYPPVLKKSLRQMSPLFSIATGMALRGIQEEE